MRRPVPDQSPGTGRLGRRPPPRQGGILGEERPLVPLHRNRDYQRLWIAHALSGFGSQASYIALPLVLLAATHSATDFGLVTFAEVFASVFAGLPAGLLVDRLPRKAVLVCCDLARTLVFALFTLAVVSHRVSLPLALAVAVLNSVFSAPFSPAASAALRHVVPREQLTAAVSLSQARAAAATLAGPLLGAALYTIAPALPFLVDAGSYLASAACLSLVLLPTGPPAKTKAGTAAEPGPGLLRDLTAGLAEVRRSPFLRYTLVNAALVNLAFAGIVLTLMTEGASSSSGGLHNGLLIAVSGAGNLVGSLFCARAGRAFSPRTLVLAVCWSTALLTPLLALDTGLAPAAVVIALCCLATPAANAVISAARLHTVPDHLQGRVQAACGFIPLLVVPFGPLATGILLDHVPVGVVLLLNAGLLLALALYSTLSSGLRNIPDLRPPPAPAVPSDGPSAAARPRGIRPASAHGRAADR
ncbi:MFS transporter [Streptacidiphilus sp. N1-12]|uniref:MFS transporter n=1 Tax=Streptacidiphilus alkalitolerans TaxID=3342712 RepID=A0ABV6WG25_9ACTN